MSDCDGAIDKAQAYINTTLPNKLSTLYASIKAKAPRAKVVVVGYPRVFNGEDCNAFTWLSPAEESRLNATGDLLNGKLSAQAGAKGFSFANPTSRFIGHAVCDNPEWINGLSNPISESFHPNVAGHSSGYTPTVSPLLTGASVRVSAATERTARASAPALTTSAKKYAARDASIKPQEFRLPDLTTPAAKKAAQKAGVDLGSRASIDRMDRVYSQRQSADLLR